MIQPDVFISYAWQGESEKIAQVVGKEFLPSRITG